MSKIIQSPGEFISNMLDKYRIPVLKFSKDISISQSAANLVVKGKTRISVPMAIKLAKYFNTNPEYWLKMQMDWDLAEAARDKKLMDSAKKISKFEKGPEPVRKPAAKPASGKKSAGKPAAGKTASGKTAKAKPAAKDGVAKKAPGRPKAKTAAAPREKTAARRGRPAGKPAGN